MEAAAATARLHPSPGLSIGLASPILLGSGIGGSFRLSRMVPTNFSGQTVHLQAVDRTHCSVGDLNTVVFD